MTMQKFKRLFIPTFCVASVLLLVDGFAHNTLLWGFAGLAIGTEIGIIISFLFAGDD